MENNSNVYPLFKEQPGHGQPYAAGAAVPAEPFTAQPSAPQPYPTGGHPAPVGHGPAAPFAQGGDYPPHTWDVSVQGPVVPAAADQAPGAALVRRVGGRLPARRPLDEVELALRQERRDQLRRRAAQGGTWVGTRAWWVLRGVGVTGRALGRAVWLPDEAADIKKMAEDQPYNARKARRELRNTRRKNLAVLLGGSGAAYLALYFFGDDLVDVLPWWSYPAAALVVVPVLGWVGRPEVVEGQEVEVHQAEAMPVSLGRDATERGVVASLTEAFADVKIRARVHGAVRAAAGWGFTATISVLDPVTEARLEALERYLNTPVGGLVLSPVTSAARFRTLRIVLEDKLAQPVLAPQRSGLAVQQAGELATRFDGGRLAVSLYARHVLLIGRTRSGKSGALHDILDLLTDASNQVVVGLDLSGGPDLKAWEPSLWRYVGGPDYAAAEKLLDDLVKLVNDRTQRLGIHDHVPTPDDPGITVAIDEYGRLAEHPRLREAAEFIVLYGAKAGVNLVAASQRKVTSFMGNQVLGSQVHVKIYMGMAAEDALALPKEIREQGVRPHLFRQASPGDDADAGKAFVVDLEPMPILIRFDRLERGEAARRAAERSGFRPELGQRDQEVLDSADTGGIPELLLEVRQAVFVVASRNGRTPERASGEEVAAYLAEHGRAIDKNALVRELREASGGLITRSRDTNLRPGHNPKGFYLEDLDAAVKTLRDRLDATATHGGGRG